MILGQLRMGARQAKNAPLTSISQKAIRDIFLFTWLALFSFTYKSLKSIFGFNHLQSLPLLLSPSHFASNVLSIWSTKGDSIVPVQISNQSWSFSVEPSQLFQQKTLEVLAKWFLTLTNAFLTFQNIVTSNSAKIVRSCRAKDPQRRQTKQMICTVKKCIQKSSQTFYLYGISHLVIQFSDLLFVGFFVVW